MAFWDNLVHSSSAFHKGMVLLCIHADTHIHARTHTHTHDKSNSE